MMILKRLLVLFVLLSCASEEGETDGLDNKIYATMSVQKSDESTPAESYLFNEAKCTLDSDTGAGSILLSSTSGSPTVEIKFKSLVSTSAQYQCQQASDNTTKGNLGMKYDKCGIQIQVPVSGSSVTNPTTNTYATYRSDDGIFTFTYDQSCTVSISSATLSASGEANIVGSIAKCGGLVETHHQGSFRNPIDDTTPRVNLSGDFKCQ